MKWLIAIVSTLLLIFILLFALLFTPPGNSIVGGIVESKLNAKLPLKTTLETFELSYDALHVELLLTPNNRISVVGNFNLFSQAFNMAYRLKLENLKALEPLSKQKLYGVFRTEGTVTGDLKTTRIQGNSDVAESNTTYHMVLNDFNPQSIIATIDGAKTEQLLAMVGKAPYALSRLHVKANMRSIDPANLDGDMAITLSDGRIDTALMQRDFNVTLPQTTLALDSKALLKSSTVDYNLKLTSNLAKIISKGTIEPKTLGMDLAYALDIAKLELFKPLTNAPLRGAVRLSGDVKGNKAKLLVRAQSDVAASDTTINAELHEFKPYAIKGEIRKLSLEKLLHMLEQPHYLSSGLLSAKIDIPDAREGNLKGDITSFISDGRVDTGTMQTELGFINMPKTVFTTKTHSQFAQSLIDTRVDVDSNLADLSIAHARFDMKDATLKSDYNATLHDLSKLRFVTKQPLRGTLTCNGDIIKDQALKATFHSATLGGTIDATLNDNDFNAHLVQLETLKILHMLYYPEVFASTLKGTLHYDLAQKKGALDSVMHKGRFTQNQMGDLLKKYAKYDLYQERFETTLNSTIAPKQIDSNLSMRGGSITINDPKMRLLTEKQSIRSDLNIVANNNPLIVKLRGNVKAPNVSVDASKLIQREAGKVINKEVGNLLNSLFKK